MAFKTECFVLRSRVWRDADRIYDLFTPAEGVIKAVLRSAAKPGNKIAGHMLPFGKVKVMIGRGKFDHLAGASVITDFKNIRTDLKNLALASSIAELFLNEESNGDRTSEFHLLDSILHFIDDIDVPDDKKMILVRVFLWKYLSISGWQPELNHCLMCNKSVNPIDSQHVQVAGHYLPGRGIICSDHHDGQAMPISGVLINFLKFIIRADWPDLIDLSVSSHLNREWLKISQAYYQSIYNRPSQALKLFIYG